MDNTIEIKLERVNQKKSVQKQEINKTNNKNGKSKKKFYFLLIIFTILFFFFSLYMLIISGHTTYLIRKPFKMLLLVLFTLNICLNLYSIYQYFTIKEETEEKSKIISIIFKIFITVFLIAYIGGSTYVMNMFYGKNDKFRVWWITNAMTSLSHQKYARFIYSEEEIQYVMSSNVVNEIQENTNGSLVDFQNKETYENEYEKAILERKKGQLYKIIDISYYTSPNRKVEGKLAVVYNPSKVSLVSALGAGNTLAAKGEMVVNMTRRTDSVIGINAGGFYDPDWNSMGGYPHGIVISKGKLLFDNKKAGVGGGIVGFDKNNKLILGRYTAEEAMKIGLRDAVEFGPYLIVNGKLSDMKGNGGWGEANRTAIGQRKDGIVLLLVLDGRRPLDKVPGASIVEVRDIMAKYGAVNAVAMDGGTSSSMVLNGKIITNPRNGSLQPFTRPVPNAWVVQE